MGGMNWQLGLGSIAFVHPGSVKRKQVHKGAPRSNYDFLMVNPQSVSPEGAVHHKPRESGARRKRWQKPNPFHPSCPAEARRRRRRLHPFPLPRQGARNAATRPRTPRPLRSPPAPVPGRSRHLAVRGGTRQRREGASPPAEALSRRGASRAAKFSFF